MFKTSSKYRTYICLKAPQNIEHTCLKAPQNIEHICLKAPQIGDHLKPTSRALSTSIIIVRPRNKLKKKVKKENKTVGFNMEEQQGGETGLPKKEENQVEERKEAKEAKEKAANNSKQSERDASKQENRVQSSRKGSFEGSEAPKLSGRTNSGSFDRMQKNGSLDSPRDRSGSCGSSVSSNGSSTSSAKSSASSNGSSKKVVVVRSAPITIGKVQLFINNTQAT